VTSAKGLCDAPLEASPYSGVNEKQLAVSALVVSAGSDHPRLACLGFARAINHFTPLNGARPYTV
jgi:hypothetical protein